MARGPGLRVIAGSMRGRRLIVPAGDRVRPTKDIVREAVFSALDARGAIVDAVVLDLYSGTGALAIEALSRGATRAVLVERDRAALDAIGHNLDLLELGDRTRVVRADVVSFLHGPPPREAPFDLVFADPPYDTTDDEVGDGSARSSHPDGSRRRPSSRSSARSGPPWPRRKGSGPAGSARSGIRL